MVIDAKELSAAVFRQLIGAGAAWMAQHEDAVNDMNVFPVPDGDTGTNMRLTMQRADQDVQALDDDVSAMQIIQAAAKGAMNGSRGNSGTILGMLFEGFAADLEQAGVLDMQHIAQAMQAAVDFAYDEISQVMTPVEGTILTVAKRVSEKAQVAQQTAESPVDFLKACVSAAWAAVEATPHQLQMLKDAGVVDSGGMGLAYILEGMQRACNGQPIEYTLSDATGNAHYTPTQRANNQPTEIDPAQHYDVQFLMLPGEQPLDVDAVRKAIREMGVSPLVYGDAQQVKVHIHVDDPTKPFAYAQQIGAELDEVVVENLHLQARRQAQQYKGASTTDADAETPHGVAVIAVATGDGLQEAFRAYGATHIVSGGQTMNPSTGDFLSIIDTLPVERVLILPNNSNILMAAQQAAKSRPDKQIQVVKSRSIPQGIVALLAFGDALLTNDNGAELVLDDIIDAMEERMEQVQSAEITTATRAARFGDVETAEGDLIGLLDGELIASGQRMQYVLDELFAAASINDYELVTLYYGADTSEREADDLRGELEVDYPDQKFELVYGGQALYPYIISME